MYGFTKGEAVEFSKLSPTVGDDFWNTIATGTRKLGTYSDLPAPDTNVDAVLCDTLVKMKNIVPTSAAQSILVGTALTALFLGCDLDLSSSESSIKRERMDLDYLIHTSSLKLRSRVYLFLGRDDNNDFCGIPNQHITSLLSTINLVFEPNEQYLVPDPSKAVPRRRRTAEAQLTDEHVVGNDEIYEDYGYPAPLAHAQPYLLLSEDPAPYRLSPPPAGDDISQQMAWIIASTRKNNSMMQKM